MGTRRCTVISTYCPWIVSYAISLCLIWLLAHDVHVEKITDSTTLRRARVAATILTRMATFCFLRTSMNDCHVLNPGKR